jgi:hypothetical protein
MSLTEDDNCGNWEDSYPTDRELAKDIPETAIILNALDALDALHGEPLVLAIQRLIADPTMASIQKELQSLLQYNDSMIRYTVLPGLKRMLASKAARIVRWNAATYCMQELAKVMPAFASFRL